MRENSRKYTLLLIVAVLFIVNIFLLRLDWQNSHRSLTFAMLDVGQGDALFIESPSGTQVMFDGGPARKVLGSLQKIMSPFDRSIDAIFITNPDADHIGGLIDILKNYEVSAVFSSGTTSDSRTFQNLKEEIKKQDIPYVLVKKGMRLDMGSDVFIDILFPDRDVSMWTTNDGSIVARMTYGNTSIMLTGDAPTKAEQIIIKNNLLENTETQLKSTILKVGHHGSRTSSSSSFVKAISPEYAFISAGKDNKYGHPHADVLNIFNQLGVKILRTDLLGTVIMKSDGKKEVFEF